MPELAIHVDAVTKKFDGRTVLDRVALDVFEGERQARGAAVDDNADTTAVGLAEGGRPEEVAERAAHPYTARGAAAAVRRGEAWSSSATRIAISRDWRALSRGSQAVVYRRSRSTSPISSAPPRHSVTLSPVRLGGEGVELGWGEVGEQENSAKLLDHRGRVRHRCSLRDRSPTPVSTA